VERGNPVLMLWKRYAAVRAASRYLDGAVGRGRVEEAYLVLAAEVGLWVAERLVGWVVRARGDRRPDAFADALEALFREPAVDAAAEHIDRVKELYRGWEEKRPKLWGPGACARL
jgi:hypothetical protein